MVICTVIGAALLLGLGDTSTAPLEAFVAIFGSADSAALPVLVDEMLLFSAQHIPDMVSGATQCSAQRSTAQHSTAQCVFMPQATQSSLAACLRSIWQPMLAPLHARRVVALSPVH